MKSKINNPWLQISAEDYEGHMSAPNVDQLQMLNKIFSDVINEFQSKSIAVLGCTTGNGFEHMIKKNIERIVGVDINPEYLSICNERFEKKLPQLELVCADLKDVEFPDSSFNLIHAALVFEYVEYELLLSKISLWLKAKGILSVVLQLPSETSAPVSETDYQSLKILNPILKIIDPDEFSNKTVKNGLNEIQHNIIKLQSGKSFSVNKYVKKDL